MKEDLADGVKENYQEKAKWYDFCSNHDSYAKRTGICSKQ